MGKKCARHDKANCSPCTSDDKEFQRLLWDIEDGIDPMRAATAKNGKQGRTS